MTLCQTTGASRQTIRGLVHQISEAQALGPGADPGHGMEGLRQGGSMADGVRPPGPLGCDM